MANVRCNRQHCSHQQAEHRMARVPGGGIVYGACQHGTCLCSQYIHEGLTTGNRVIDMYGDGGFAGRTGPVPREQHARSSAYRVVRYDI